MFRKLLIALLIVCSASVALATPPDYSPAFGKSTANYKWSDADNKFIAERTNSDGTTPTTDARGSVGTGTPYYAELSTSTPTLLSAIASWSAHDIIEIQCNNVAFRSVVATTTAETVWKGKRLGQWDIFIVIPSADSASWDMSWIASSSAAASISVDVRTPRP